MNIGHHKPSECWKMGCVTSKKDINDVHPNIFQVTNVDELRNPLSFGELEVNETEIVFYQRGKPPVHWPLKSLRRYGYDSQFFSFESGRRCQTGPGIYAFNCVRAERLFNYVQAHVQMRNNDDAISRDVSTPTPGVQSRPQDSNYLEPTPLRHSLPRLSILNGPSRLSSVGSSNGCTSPSPPLPNNNYANDCIFKLEEKSIPLSVPEEPAPVGVKPVSTTYQNIPLSPKETSSDIENQDNSRIYMNIIPGEIKKLRGDINLNHSVVEDWDDYSPAHCYANLAPGEIEGLTKLKGRFPLMPLNKHSVPFEPLSPSGLSDQVNYIVLDLDKHTAPPSPIAPQNPDSPKKPSEGYATIDFDKTVALSHSIKPTLENDFEGSRKTRHNSTITELATRASSRHSASLSD